MLKKIATFSEANEDDKLTDSASDSSAKEGANESEVETKEDETTPAAAEATSEQPRGLGNLRRKLLFI